MTDLEKVLAFIDEDEGPELNISDGEPGGSSKHGVSMETLRAWRKKRGMSPPTMDDMRNMNSSLAATIYSEMFAAPIRFNDLPSGVNYRILDISISAGYPTGVLSVISSVLGSAARFDDATISAIKNIDPKELIPALGTAWLAFKLKQAEGNTKYLKGWTNRRNKADARALAMVEQSTAQPQPKIEETKMSSWRLANSIQQLLKQVNAEDPHRRKDADGGIGDAAHASRKSDHNPYIIVRGQGVVRAYDFTHAPETGFDGRAFAEMLLKNKDPRIRYIISNYRIAYGKDGQQPWKWLPYLVPPNKNPHDHHTHVSVTEKEAEFDSPSRWNLSGMAEAASAQGEEANSYVPPPTTLRLKARGELVKKMQTGIGLTGASVDGFFGPNTEKALKAYQKAHDLVADGICGPQTWKTFTAA